MSLPDGFQSIRGGSAFPAELAQALKAAGKPAKAFPHEQRYPARDLPKGAKHTSADELVAGFIAIGYDLASAAGAAFSITNIALPFAVWDARLYFIGVQSVTALTAPRGREIPIPVSLAGSLAEWSERDKMPGIPLGDLGQGDEVTVTGTKGFPANVAAQYIIAGLAKPHGGWFRYGSCG